MNRFRDTVNNSKFIALRVARHTGNTVQAVYKEQVMVHTCIKIVPHAL